MKVRLEADFDDFEQVVFYRRGVRTRQEEVKHLFGLRRRTIDVHQLREGPRLREVQGRGALRGEGQETSTSLPFTPGSTIIKLFQDVPRADLEMLFPNAQVRMRPIDKLLIGVPAVVSGVVVVVTKLIASLLPVCCSWRFWFGAAQGARGAQPGPARRARGGAGGRRRLPGPPVHEVQEPQDPVHEVAVGEPLLPQPRQRRRGVPPPPGRSRGGRGQGGGARLPLPPQRRAAADRRRAGPADRGLVRRGGGTPRSTSRSTTAWASCAGCG